MANNAYLEVLVLLNAGAIIGYNAIVNIDDTSGSKDAPVPQGVLAAARWRLLNARTNYVLRQGHHGYKVSAAN